MIVKAVQRKRVPWRALVVCTVGLLALGAQAAADSAAGGDAALSWASQALSSEPGDAARGRDIVANRGLGLCVLCHPSTLAGAHLQGDLAPDLKGVGQRLSTTALRARMMNSRRISPESIMPAYYSQEPLTQLPKALQGKTLLNGQQIEDVVAYLRTL